MKKWLLVFFGLALVVTFGLPAATSAAPVDVDAKVKPADIEVAPNYIDIKLGAKEAAKIDGAQLKVDKVLENGVPVEVKEKLVAKTHVRLEGLKPSIEYCFNLKVGVKALQLVDLKVKADGKAGDLVCVTTKKPGEQPGNPDPTNPGDNPGNDNPGNDNPGNNNPGDDNNNGGKDNPGNNNGGDNNGKDDGKNGGKLPKTASPYANNIVIGASLLAAGLGALAIRRRMA